MNFYFSEILIKDISPSCKLIYNKVDKSKYQLKLHNVRCPFGPEEFKNKIYLNVELKKDDIDHQVLLKDIKLIESYLLKDTNKEKVSNIKGETLFKLTIPQINKKLITKVYKNQKEENIFETKGKICDIIIDINSIWQFGEKSGVQFTARTINVLN
jgi:hypothetical protein